MYKVNNDFFENFEWTNSVLKIIDHILNYQHTHFISFYRIDLFGIPFISIPIYSKHMFYVLAFFEG
jgi:hypothetical protein